MMNGGFTVWDGIATEETTVRKNRRAETSTIQIDVLQLNFHPYLQYTCKQEGENIGLQVNVLKDVLNIKHIYRMSVT